jgi:hypothetical protein
MVPEALTPTEPIGGRCCTLYDLGVRTEQLTGPK